MILYIGKIRKDGKIPVTYCFNSGKRINKLITPQEVLEEQQRDFVEIRKSPEAGRMKAW